MKVNSGMFADDPAKILFMLSQCEGGSTKPWETALLLKKSEKDNWGTWETFKKLFKQTFYLAQTAKDATMKLANIQMKDGMKLKDFEAVWDMLTHQADITPDLRHWYYFQSKLPIKLYSELQRLDITMYEQGCAEA